MLRVDECRKVVYYFEEEASYLNYIQLYSKYTEDQIETRLEELSILANKFNDDT